MIVDRRTKVRLASLTRFGDIRELGSVDSTNRFLVDLARAGGAEGIVVVADHQTAGRGRMGRTWEARPGQALLASILLRPGATGLAPDRRHLVTAAVALAAAGACRSVAGVTPAVKWPNDLLAGGRKLAGILAVAEGDVIVVGIGINVGWAPPGAAWLLEGTPPAEAARPADAARPTDAGPPDADPAPDIRGRLLADLLVGLEDRYGRWDQVAAEYRRRCHTVGRRVRVELPGRTLVGVADSVDDGGRLRVIPDGPNRPGPTVELSAADVVHLRGEDDFYH